MSRRQQAVCALPFRGPRVPRPHVSEGDTPQLKKGYHFLTQKTSKILFFLLRAVLTTMDNVGAVIRGRQDPEFGHDRT